MTDNRPALLIDGKPVGKHLPHVKKHQRAARAAIAALASNSEKVPVRSRGAQPSRAHRCQDRGSADDPPEHDEFVPDPQVIRELGITAMSLWRWDRDAELIAAGWPPAIRIRHRKFRSRRALEAFKMTMARRAIAERTGR